VGHEVVRALVRAGVAVRVLDPGPPHPRWPAGVEHQRGSLLDPQLLSDAMQDMDGVFHVAGVWDGSPGGDARMRELNVGGTEAVLKHGLPTVLTSSSITCGFGPLSRPGSEDQASEDPRNPIRGTGALYRETKLALEALAAKHGAWMVNPDYVIGPGDVGGVVTGPLLRAARMPVIPSPAGGKCFVSGHDVGIGHVLAWKQAQPGRRYLLGSENVPYAKIFQRIALLMGRRPRVIPIPRGLPGLLSKAPKIGARFGAIEQMMLPRYRSHKRAAAELGFTPQPIESAIKQMIEETAPAGP
jgi:dihydroflavonol-4-reductase